MKKEGEVAPNVNIDSPTSINTSSGLIPPLRVSRADGFQHRHTRILCLSDGSGSSVPLPTHEQETSKKGGKAHGNGKNQARAIQMNPQWNQGGPRPGTAYHAGGSTAHNALPFILAMSRQHGEQEFQRGATRMTELLEDNMSAPRLATWSLPWRCDPEGT